MTTTTRLTIAQRFNALACGVAALAVSLTLNILGNNLAGGQEAETGMNCLIEAFTGTRV